MSSSILIVGPSKTGTTGVYNMLKAAVVERGQNYAFLFEPTRPEPFVALGRYAPQRPILTKVVDHRLETCRIHCSHFDKRIMTVRDPRDVVVSRLLFRPLMGNAVRTLGRDDLEPFVQALRRKEADPRSRSVKSLHDLLDDMGITPADWSAIAQQMRHTLDVAQREDFFVLRYEDFVQGRLDNFSEYVELPLRPAAPTEGWLQHISRSRGFGEWKSWFLDEDVAFFGEVFAEYLAAFGYTSNELAADPHIDPETSSRYVELKVAQRLDQVRTREETGRDVERLDDVENVELLRNMAEDGNAELCYRYALFLDRGSVGARDAEGAVHWAGEAAVRGHPEGMELLAQLLRERGAQDPESRRRLHFWEREAAQALRERREKLERQQVIKDLRKQVKVLKQRNRALSRQVNAQSDTGAPMPPVQRPAKSAASLLSRLRDLTPSRSNAAERTGVADR